MSLRLARSTIACLPVALWRGRVIGTDCRPLPVLHVSSDNQEREQGSGEDYPTIRADQNEPCHRWQYIWQYVRFVYPYRRAASAPVGAAITGNGLRLCLHQGHRSHRPRGHRSLRHRPLPAHSGLARADPTVRVTTYRVVRFDLRCLDFRCLAAKPLTLLALGSAEYNTSDAGKCGLAALFAALYSPEFAVVSAHELPPASRRRAHCNHSRNAKLESYA
jgi:hypothetical protein